MKFIVRHAYTLMTIFFACITLFVVNGKFQDDYALRLYIGAMLGAWLTMAGKLDSRRRERDSFIDGMAGMQKLWNNHAKPMFADCNFVGAGMTVNRQMTLNFNGKKYNTTVQLELVG